MMSIWAIRMFGISVKNNFWRTENWTCESKISQRWTELSFRLAATNRTFIFHPPAPLHPISYLTTFRFTPQFIFSHFYHQLTMRKISLITSPTVHSDFYLRLHNVFRCAESKQKSDPCWKSQWRSWAQTTRQHCYPCWPTRGKEAYARTDKTSSRASQETLWVASLGSIKGFWNVVGKSLFDDYHFSEETIRHFQWCTGGFFAPLPRTTVSSWIICERERIEAKGNATAEGDEQFLNGDELSDDE